LTASAIYLTVLLVLRHARCVSCAGERSRLLLRACGPLQRQSNARSTQDGANRRSILDTGALLRMGARRFGICIQKCACQGTTLLCGAAVCTLTAPCPCKKPSPRPDQIGSAPTALCPLPSACHLFSWPQSSRLSDLFTPFSAPVQLCILYVLLVWTLTPHHLITENS
jgi:hypothetical protein